MEDVDNEGPHPQKKVANARPAAPNTSSNVSL